MFDYFFLPMALKLVNNIRHYFDFFLHITLHTNLFRTLFGVFLGGIKMTSILKFRVLTSCLTSRVSCFSPWARQNFPAPLKIEQTLSHR